MGQDERGPWVRWIFPWDGCHPWWVWLLGSYSLFSFVVEVSIRGYLILDGGFICCVSVLGFVAFFSVFFEVFDFVVERSTYDAVFLARRGKNDTHRVASTDRNLVHCGADDVAGFHHHEDFGIGEYDFGTDQFAAFFWQVGNLDAVTATVLGAVVVDRGALGETAIGDGEDIGFVFDDTHGQQLVFFTEFHALHTGGCTPHGAQCVVGRGDAPRLA